MRIQSRRYLVVALCTVAIMVAMTCLPGISEARTPRTKRHDVQSYEAGSQAESGQGSTALAEVLNPDGTLNLPRGFNGNLDPAGFTLAAGPDGEPRFIPAQGKGEEGAPEGKAGEPGGPLAAPGTYKWDKRFNQRGPNYLVMAIAVDGNNVYVGGAFAAVSDVTVNYIARWDGSTWNAMGTGANDYVRAIAISGSNVYVGGDFTQIGGVAANHVARWNGTSWSRLGIGLLDNGVNGDVLALVSSGSNIFVGGNFGSAGGSTASRIARWDGIGWSSLGSGMNGLVQSLAVSSNIIYAGGDFTTAGGTPANYVARWDGSSWSALGGGLDWYVSALAVSGSDLYVGGSFASAGGEPAESVARWDGSNWSALGSGLDGGSVKAITVVGSDVYVGGAFDEAGGQSANKLARWDGSNWFTLPALPGLDSDAVMPVNVIAGSSSETGLYVGGAFSSDVSDYFVIWNGTGWAAVGTGNGLPGDVYAVAVQDNGATVQVYVGGLFSYAGDLPVNNIARWDGSAWNALGSGVDGNVNDIEVSGTNVYVGGWFTQAGGITAKNIAKWNGSAWSSVGTGHANGVNNAVFDMAVSGVNVYVGGRFTTAGGNTANYIAKWNGTIWSAMLSGPFNQDNGVNGYVHAVAVRQSNLYVGGAFTRAGDIAARNIARWSGHGWSPLASGVNGGVGAIAINSDGSRVYVGGIFTHAGSLQVNQIARWNTYTGTWSALGGGLGGYDSIPLPPQVLTIALSSSELVYVGGYFATAGGVTVNNLALWNGSTWSSPGSTSWPTYELGYAQVYSVAIRDADYDTLFIAGKFAMIDGVPSSNFGRRYFQPIAP